MGIADAIDARPIDIRRGRIVFEDVTLHYGGHPAPLYNGLSVDIRPGERVGLVGHIRITTQPFDAPELRLG